MMEVWNTETEKAKAIIGLSRCLVTCTVNAIGPILLASVRGLCLPLCPGGRNGPGKAALKQQTHESEVTSQPGMVNCEVLIGKYPELLPSDWTRCCRVSPLHELSCPFVERSLLWNATGVKMLEGWNVILCLSRLPVTLAVNAVGRILLAFVGALSLYLRTGSPRNIQVKWKSKPNRQGGSRSFSPPVSRAPSKQM